MEPETQAHVLELGAFLREEPIPRSRTTLNAVLEKAGLSNMVPEQKELLSITPWVQLVEKILWQLGMSRDDRSIQQVRRDIRWLRVLLHIARDPHDLALLQHNSSAHFVQLLENGQHAAARPQRQQNIKQSLVDRYNSLLVELACTVANGLEGSGCTEVLEEVGCFLATGASKLGHEDRHWKMAVDRWKQSVALKDGDWAPVLGAIARLQPPGGSLPKSRLQYMIKQLLDALAAAHKLTPDSIEHCLQSVYAAGRVPGRHSSAALVLCQVIGNDHIPLDKIAPQMKQMAGDEQAAPLHNKLLSRACSVDWTGKPHDKHSQLRAALQLNIPAYAMWHTSATMAHRLLAYQLSKADVLADVQPLVGYVQQLMPQLVQRLQQPCDDSDSDSDSDDDSGSDSDGMSLLDSDSMSLLDSDGLSLLDSETDEDNNINSNSNSAVLVYFSRGFGAVMDMLEEYASQVSRHQSLWQSPAHQQALPSILPHMLKQEDRRVQAEGASGRLKPLSFTVWATGALLEGGMAAQLLQHIPAMCEMLITTYPAGSPHLVWAKSARDIYIAWNVQRICDDCLDSLQESLQPWVVAALGKAIERIDERSRIFPNLAAVADKFSSVPSTCLDPEDPCTWQVQQQLLEHITAVLRSNTSTTKLEPLVQLLLSCAKKPFSKGQSSAAHTPYMQTMKAWCELAANLVDDISNHFRPQQQLLCRVVEQLSMLAKDDPDVLQYTVRFGKAWDRLADLASNNATYQRLAAAMYGIQRAVAKQNEWPVYLAAQLALLSIAGGAQAAQPGPLCRPRL